MTPHNGWHRLVGALAASAIAGTLFVGIGAPTAIAAPGDDETSDTEAPAEPTMTGEQALAIIQQDYDLGAGGGQLSNFVHEVLILRNLGFRPSKANQTAIVAGPGEAAEPGTAGRGPQGDRRLPAQDSRRRRRRSRRQAATPASPSAERQRPSIRVVPRSSAPPPG